MKVRIRRFRLMTWTDPWRKKSKQWKSLLGSRCYVGNKKRGVPVRQNIELAGPCPIDVLEAAEAGRALGVVARKLSNAGILTGEGARILELESRRIAKLKAAKDWSLVIDPSDPIKFEWTKDKNDEDVQPSLSASLSVNQGIVGRPPFAVLDIAIQMDTLDDRPIARWHIDLANEHRDGFQTGPLFHLQFGGHQRGYRELDHPLKAPRWCHPPMEVALFCEVVAANFFEDRWLELREDESWCVAIGSFEKLCYPIYINKMISAMTHARSTALNQMWAEDWMKSLQD
jgi:hypothetical protein